MVDHCITAFLERQKQKLYQTYITDTLKIIAENTANYAGGSAPTARWIEIADGLGKVEEEKTADEVISDIRMKIKNL